MSCSLSLLSHWSFGFRPEREGHGCLFTFTIVCSLFLADFVAFTSICLWFPSWMVFDVDYEGWMVALLQIGDGCLLHVGCSMCGLFPIYVRWCLWTFLMAGIWFWISDAVFVWLRMLDLWFCDVWCLVMEVRYWIWCLCWLQMLLDMWFGDVCCLVMEVGSWICDGCQHKFSSLVSWSSETNCIKRLWILISEFLVVVNQLQFGVFVDY